MTQPNKSRPYILGLSIGTFWLIAASTGFAILSIALSHITNQRIILIALGIAAAALLSTSLGQIRKALNLPKETNTTDRSMGRWFIWVVVLEVVGVGIVNTINFLYGNPSLFVPLDLIIVGIHFIPLAKLFGVPRYTILGILFCVFSVLALLLFPSDAYIGSAMARFFVSSLGCAAACWGVSISSQLELRRLLMAPPKDRGRLHKI
jgi:hypothetical protein